MVALLNLQRDFDEAARIRLEKFSDSAKAKIEVAPRENQNFKVSTSYNDYFDGKLTLGDFFGDLDKWESEAIEIQDRETTLLATLTEGAKALDDKSEILEKMMTSLKKIQEIFPSKDNSKETYEAYGKFVLAAICYGAQLDITMNARSRQGNSKEQMQAMGKTAFQLEDSLWEMDAYTLYRQGIK